MYEAQGAERPGPCGGHVGKALLDHGVHTLNNRCEPKKLMQQWEER